jgi:hypothetical protein
MKGNATHGGLKRASRLALACLAIAGFVSLVQYLMPAKVTSNDAIVAAIDRCSSSKKSRNDPGEWIKCVAQKSSYEPLSNESKYLAQLVGFHGEVGQRIANKACSKAHNRFTQKGYDDPLLYIVNHELSITESELLAVEKLKAAGEDPFLVKNPQEWNKRLGASAELAQAIAQSSYRTIDDGDFVLNEYLDQLRLVIHRKYFLSTLHEKCPERLKSVNSPLY